MRICGDWKIKKKNMVKFVFTCWKYCTLKVNSFTAPADTHSKTRKVSPDLGNLLWFSSFRS